MGLAYRLSHPVRFAPWEKMAALPAARQVSRLFDREQAGHRPPLGRALDLGCGSGLWTVDLASRGWQVTGIDLASKALRQARARAEAAVVDVRLVEGDVTDLGAAGVGAAYRLLIDFGCFHDELTDAQRQAEAHGATMAAAPGATLLLMCFAPGRRWPFPRGASRQQIEEAFRGWEMLADEPVDVTGAPRYVRRADPRFFRLRRL